MYVTWHCYNFGMSPPWIGDCVRIFLEFHKWSSVFVRFLANIISHLIPLCISGVQTDSDARQIFLDIFNNADYWVTRVMWLLRFKMRSRADRSQLSTTHDNNEVIKLKQFVICQCRVLCSKQGVKLWPSARQIFQQTCTSPVSESETLLTQFNF